MLISKNQNEEYGYVPSNPVLLNGYADIQHFFEELHTEKGCMVTYRRIGSTFEAQSNHMIDVFEVSGDNGNKLLYLDVYGNGQFNAPKGYKLAPKINPAKKDR